jgi:hypothetical protein
MLPGLFQIPLRLPLSLLGSNVLLKTDPWSCDLSTKKSSSQGNSAAAPG